MGGFFLSEKINRNVRVYPFRKNYNYEIKNTECKHKNGNHFYAFNAEWSCQKSA